MRAIELIVIHCSATPVGLDIGVREIDRMHKSRGWSRIGYHYVIRINGTIEPGRTIDMVGAHVAGHNYASIGICLVGGLDRSRQPADTFSEAQYRSLAAVVADLKDQFPQARVCGHRDLSPDLNKDGKITENEWMKACPCFDAEEWATQKGFNRGVA